jgi:hypothetical protein
MSRWDHAISKNMVGEMIILRVPVLEPEEMAMVKLHAVDPNGIWIESQDFTDAMMTKLPLTASAPEMLLIS